MLDNQDTYGFALTENFADLWNVEVDSRSEEMFALNFWVGAWWNGNAVYGSPTRPGDEGD